MGAMKTIQVALKNLVLGAAAKWVFGTALALLLAAAGVQTVSELLSKVPWSYIGLLGAAFVGLFAGGLLVEIRAVRRSSKLLHWLSRVAPSTDDFDRVEWAFSVFMPNEAAMDKKMTPIIEGYVRSKRRSKTDNITGFLQIDEDGGHSTYWVACKRNSLTFRNASEEKRITLRALPLGVVGNELIFLHWLGRNSDE